MARKLEITLSEPGLEKCPCCRGDATFGSLTTRTHAFSVGLKFKEITHHFVSCTACGLNNCGPGRLGGFDSMTEAAEVWNRRIEAGCLRGKIMILTDALENRGVKVTPDWVVHGDPITDGEEKG